MKLAQLIPALAIAAFACSSQEATPSAGQKQAEPIAVATAIVMAEEWAEPIIGTGTVAASKTTDIGPLVSGVIDEIFVAVGNRVPAGAPLFHTRANHYENRVAQAESQLRLARAEVVNASRERGRIGELHEKHVASDQRRDEVGTAWEIATARRDLAEAMLAEARQDLADTLVRAPYDAVITQRYVDEGTMLTTMLSSSARVVQIMKVDLVIAIVQLPEIHLPRIHVGTPSRVRVAGTATDYETYVAVLNDRADPVSRAFEVRLPIENKDHTLKPGLSVEAELRPEARKISTLDRAAVLGSGESRWVFVPEGDHAARREVRVRELDARRLEIVEGLIPGDQVLVGSDLSRLEPGVPIRIEGSVADR
ncbi:MAG: hypothetical protein DCC71_00180 [Proteobacteria bacterium]|nr:MAG: hypothetical protein DCC71_00180 [Pseudomonadota bacterium]